MTKNNNNLIYGIPFLYILQKQCRVVIGSGPLYFKSYWHLEVFCLNLNEAKRFFKYFSNDFLDYRIHLQVDDLIALGFISFSLQYFFYHLSFLWLWPTNKITILKMMTSGALQIAKIQTWPGWRIICYFPLPLQHTILIISSIQMNGKMVVNPQSIQMREYAMNWQEWRHNRSLSRVCQISVWVWWALRVVGPHNYSTFTYYSWKMDFIRTPV
jgi:hypothetical protein